MRPSCGRYARAAPGFDRVLGPLAFPAPQTSHSQTRPENRGRFVGATTSPTLRLVGTLHRKVVIVSDALIADLANPPQRRVTFAQWLEQQTPDSRAALEAAAGNPEWASGHLYTLLHGKYGAPVTHSTIKSWREKHGYVG